MVASLPLVTRWGNGHSVHVRGKPRPGCAGQIGQSGGVVWQRSRQGSARAAGRSPRPWCPAPGGCGPVLRDDQGPARPSFAANDRDGGQPHASGPRCARRPVKPGPREPHGLLADLPALRLQQLPARARRPRAESGAAGRKSSVPVSQEPKGKRCVIPAGHRLPGRSQAKVLWHSTGGSAGALPDASLARDTGRAVTGGRQRKN